MRLGRCIYAGAVLVALVIGLGFWKPLHVIADHDRDHSPRFRVDPSWPRPLPAPVGYNPLTWPGCGPGGCQATTQPPPDPNCPAANGNGCAHAWVLGEVAGSCTDAHDNVYTFNRGWETGVNVAGTVVGGMSGGITAQDATPAKALPSPPVVVFNSEGKTTAGWGNPALNTGSASGAYSPTAAAGRSLYLPNGAHGCFVDYQGYVWLGGNADGIVQKYNPKTAAAAGAQATYVAQIGLKDDCDTATGICGEAGATNSSTTKLNEPPDMAVDPEPDPVTGTRGSVYIADGYGNHRVVVYTTTDGITYTYNRQFGTDCGHNETPNGTATADNPCPLGTFGHSGGGHPHCIVLGNDGNVWACDRPNNRIEVFTKTGTPLYEIHISNFPTATPANRASILSASNRACDMDFYPNIDYLATKSPTHQKYIVNVDLQSDNTYLMDKASGAVLYAFGRCGVKPCPGHNPAEFAYGHMTNVDSKGNVYISETITGRRIQKFVRTEGEKEKHHDKDDD